MYNLLNDLQIFTGISLNSLNSLVDKSNKDICQCILESQLDNSTCQIDIGIGQLIIIEDNNELIFKFIPSNKLQSDIIKTLDTGVSPLQLEIEKSSTEKVIKIYKELF